MQAWIETLKKAETVAILPHVHADGDAISASLALGKLLEAWDIPYTVYTEEPLGEDLAFLGASVSLLPEALPTVHTAVAVDCGDAGRLGRRLPLFEAAKVRMVVDHHATNDGFGDKMYIDASAAATAEIMAEIFQAAGVPLSLAATLLYTGICTDTGGFRYSNTTAKTHAIAAKLLKAGAESGEVCRSIFEQNRIEKMQLEALVVSNMELLHGGKTAIATLSTEQMERIGAKDEDAGNLAGLLRSIRGVEAGVLVRERDGEIKISVRTHSFLDAAALCKALGGGGHARAAGANVQGTLSQWKEKMKAYIGEAYERHS